MNKNLKNWKWSTKSNRNVRGNELCKQPFVVYVYNCDN